MGARGRELGNQLLKVFFLEKSFAASRELGQSHPSRCDFVLYGSFTLFSVSTQPLLFPFRRSLLPHGLVFPVQLKRAHIAPDRCAPLSRVFRLSVPSVCSCCTPPAPHTWRRVLAGWTQGSATCLNAGEGADSLRRLFASQRRSELLVRRGPGGLAPVDILVLHVPSPDERISASAPTQNITENSSKWQFYRSPGGIAGHLPPHCLQERHVFLPSDGTIRTPPLLLQPVAFLTLRHREHFTVSAINLQAFPPFSRFSPCGRLAGSLHSVRQERALRQQTASALFFSRMEIIFKVPPGLVL